MPGHAAPGRLPHYTGAVFPLSTSNGPGPHRPEHATSRPLPFAHVRCPWSNGPGPHRPEHATSRPLPFAHVRCPWSNGPGPHRPEHATSRPLPFAHVRCPWSNGPGPQRTDTARVSSTTGCRRRDTRVIGPGPQRTGPGHVSSKAVCPRRETRLPGPGRRSAHRRAGPPCLCYALGCERAAVAGGRPGAARAAVEEDRLPAAHRRQDAVDLPFEALQHAQRVGVGPPPHFLGIADRLLPHLLLVTLGAAGG